MLVGCTARRPQGALQPFGQGDKALAAQDDMGMCKTSLFAALDIATGAVIGTCCKRHRATEFLDFLKKIDAAMSTIIDPFVGEKIPNLDIEDVRIASASVMPFALIFYELCTNAIKYGALGQLDGHLSVVARRKGDRFIIDWQECCDIDPDAARGEGFGTKMCQDVAKSSLGGTITRQIEATGMRTKIDLDMAFIKV